MSLSETECDDDQLIDLYTLDKEEPAEEVESGDIEEAEEEEIEYVRDDTPTLVLEIIANKEQCTKDSECNSTVSEKKYCVEYSIEDRFGEHVLTDKYCLT